MACSSSPALLLFDQHSWIFTLGSGGILHWGSTGDLTEKGRKFDALETFEVTTFVFFLKDPNSRILENFRSKNLGSLKAKFKCSIEEFHTLQSKCCMNV